MGSILALFSSLLWGTADYLAGNLSKRYRSIAVTGVSQFFGLIFGLSALLIAAIFGKELIEPNLLSDGYFIPGVIAGISGFIGLLAFYTGLATGRMGVVSPIASLAAVIPLTFAFLDGERPTMQQNFGLAIALLGAFLASGPEVKGGLPLRPLLYALIAAFGFGGALTFIAIGSQVDSLHTMTTMRLASVSICIFIAIRAKSLGGFSKLDLPTLVFVGIADFLANFLLGIATTKGLISIAMVLGSLFPIVTSLLAFRFLGERLHRVQYFGIAFAVGGVALISAG
jgi:drug/metabolite transporter (DMT)-like permease